MFHLCHVLLSHSNIELLEYIKTQAMSEALNFVNKRHDDKQYFKFYHIFLSLNASELHIRIGYCIYTNR